MCVCKRLIEKRFLSGSDFIDFYLSEAIFPLSTSYFLKNSFDGLTVSSADRSLLWFHATETRKSSISNFARRTNGALWALSCHQIQFDCQGIKTDQMQQLKAMQKKAFAPGNTKHFFPQQRFMKSQLQSVTSQSSYLPLR